MPSSDWLSLIILILCIVLFVTEKFSMATTAILGCVLMVVFGVADFDTVFGQFSSSSVILLISMMIMGQALFDTGVAQLLGHALIQAAKGSERRLVALATLSCAMISAFLSNVATLAMFFALFSNLAKNDRKMDVRNFMLPLGMASVVGGVATMIGSAPQLSTQQFLLENGLPGFHVFDYSYVGIFLILWLTVYVTFIGYPIGKRIWGNTPNEVFSECDTVELIKIKNTSRMALMGGIFLVTIILLFLEPIPMAVIATSGALASVMTGCISAKDAIKSIHWSSVLKLAGCLGLLKAVSAAGGTVLFGQLLVGILGDTISPYLLLILVIVITQLLSEFMTNTAALMIVLPVAASICMKYGFSVHAYAMAMTLSCSTALCCPLSNTPLTMVSAYGYKFADFLKCNLLWDISADVLIFILIPIFFPLVA